MKDKKQRRGREEEKASRFRREEEKGDRWDRRKKATAIHRLTPYRKGKDRYPKKTLAGAKER